MKWEGSLLRRNEHIVIVQDDTQRFLAEVRRTDGTRYEVVALAAGENLIEAITNLNINLSFARSHDHYSHGNRR